MATRIPATSSLIENEHERTVFDAFDNALPPEWYVIHSLKGTEAQKRKKPRQWEADVTLFHPDYGIIVVEVKGGKIKLENGTWTQNGASMSNPVEQCRDAAGALARSLTKAVGRSGPVLIPRSVAVCFPSHDVEMRPSDALDDVLLPRGLLEQKSAGRLINWVNAKVANDQLNADLTWPEARKALGLMNPTIAPRVLPAHEVQESLSRLEAVTGEVLTATEEQLDALSAVGEYKRLCLYGGAGTGKTLIGISTAKKASQQGKRVLFLTAGGRLHEQISELISGDLVEVRTVSEFIKELCLAADIPVAERVDSPSKARAYSLSREEGRALARFLDELPARALGLLEHDVVILDEAQSRETDQLDDLTMLFSLEDEATILLLADPAQRVEPGAWVAPKGYNVIPLQTNCRNADLICFLLQLMTGRRQFSASTQSLSVRIKILPGAEKELTADLVEAAAVELQRLKKTGLSGITVVTHGWDRDALREGLAKFPEIPIESIIGFRGCESDAILTVLPRASLFPLYVASSRAKVALSVIAREHAFEEVSSEHLKEAASYGVSKDQVSPEAMSLVGTFFC